MRRSILVTILLLGMLPTISVAADDALIEVNTARIQRRLPPFVPDPGLTAAAKACADYRAANLIRGHTRNDFQFLPMGTRASAAGCAALTPDWGWQSCCSWERWQFAGAAVTMGRDGRRYMQLFVR